MINFLDANNIKMIQ